MCAYVDLKATKEFLAKHKGRKQMRMYKVFKENYTYAFNTESKSWDWLPTITGPYYTSFVYHVGLNCSTPSAKVQKQDNKQINRGFHLFRSIQKAVNSIDMYGRVLLPVYVDVKDFVCVSKSGEVVFTKLTLTEKSYRMGLAAR